MPTRPRSPLLAAFWLLTAILPAAAQTIALPNEASVALHKRFGFTEVGVFRDYAIKGHDSGKNRGLLEDCPEFRVGREGFPCNLLFSLLALV